MLKRLALPVLASALVLASAALTSASAGHFGGRGGGGFHGGFRGGHFGHSHFGHGNRFGGHHFFGQRRFVVRHWGHWHNHWRGGVGYYGAGYAPVYGSDAYPVAAAPATCPGNCLGKEYLEDGSVRFFDRCSKESAIGAPAGAPRG